MRRNRNQVSYENQDTDRWLISYADFVTLLFAFFVVLYSISQVNSSKYKILSQSLEGVFDAPPKSNQVIQIGDPSLSLQPVTGDDIEQPEVTTENDERGRLDSENFASSEAFKDLEKGLEASLGDLIDQDLAEINSDANWINIVLKSGLLFSSGSDTLNTEAEPLMQEVAKHLNSNQQLILVHGHTDNIPITTEKFPSNWELSGARGVAVVRKLQKLLVQPNRMSVEAHGEFQPVADNNTIEGRKENRRVVISISRKQRVAKLDSGLRGDNSGITVEERKNGTTAGNGNVIESKLEKEKEPEYKIIKLPGGGILIRGNDSPQQEQKSSDN
jgi:chemotaxis protein MotB